MQNRLRLSVIGFWAGLLLGYPISYYFQPGALRMKASIGDYISHISDVMKADELRGTAIGVWIGCVLLFTVVGAVIDGLKK